MILELLALAILAMPIYPFIVMIRSLKGRGAAHETEGNIKNAKQSFLGVFYMFLLFFLIVLGFWFNSLALDGGEQLAIYELGGGIASDYYAPLSHDHMFTMITFFIFGMIAYGLLYTFKELLSPVIYILCSVLLVIHVLFTIIYFTHTGFTHYKEYISTAGSVIFLQVGYLSLSFLYIAALKDSMDYFLKSQAEKGMQNTNKWIAFLYQISFKYQRLPVIWAVFLFPVIFIVQMILVLFGQRPDSFIRVFMDTSSFNYSSITPPEPSVVPGDGHYLCTVTARGHKKLVKPIRSGERGGIRIPVNRQLLVANAFEHILEDYTPNFHRHVRSFYDRYGYPISKHIRKKWAADIVYLLMKPLEWLFLFVLYAVDKNPENRIHVQYSELRK